MVETVKLDFMIQIGESVELNLLQKLNIPIVDLEEYRCPKYDACC